MGNVGAALKKVVGDGSSLKAGSPREVLTTLYTGLVAETSVAEVHAAMMEWVSNHEKVQAFVKDNGINVEEADLLSEGGALKNMNDEQCQKAFALLEAKLKEKGIIPE